MVYITQSIIKYLVKQIIHILCFIDPSFIKVTQRAFIGRFSFATRYGNSAHTLQHADGLLDVFQQRHILNFHQYLSFAGYCSCICHNSYLLFIILCKGTQLHPNNST